MALSQLALVVLVGIAAARAPATSQRDGLVGSIATARPLVPNGQGCSAVMHRSSCCMFRDGRLDTVYGGEDCVPSVDGKVFSKGTKGPVCEPACFARGQCGDDAVDQSSKIGVCAGRDSWFLLGKDHACRADATDSSWNGRGEAVQLSNVADLSLCKKFCEQALVCTGIEFNAQRKHCEIWTRPTGATAVQLGFDCWAFAPPAPAAVAPAASPAPSHHGRMVEWAQSSSSSAEDQCHAGVPIGGALRFYVVGTGNCNFQNWADMLHAKLKDLGYIMNMEPLNIHGARNQPEYAPTCADASTYDTLITPRLCLGRWMSSGFAYPSKADCDAEGYRQIAGYPVSCTNADSCKNKNQGYVTSVNATHLAWSVRGAHFVVLSNWFWDNNEAATKSRRNQCFNGADVAPYLSADISFQNLKRLIGEIHKQNPSITVLVLGLFPDAQDVFYVNEKTLSLVNYLNQQVKEKLWTVPKTYFVDTKFPLGERVFQDQVKGFLNCRGDKVVATRILEVLFQRKVVTRGLMLDSAEECLGVSACAGLCAPCCLRSALCYIDQNGNCTAYPEGGPGTRQTLRI